MIWLVRSLPGNHSTSLYPSGHLSFLITHIHVCKQTENHGYAPKTLAAQPNGLLPKDLVITPFLLTAEFFHFDTYSSVLKHLLQQRNRLGNLYWVVSNWIPTLDERKEQRPLSSMAHPRNIANVCKAYVDDGFVMTHPARHYVKQGPHVRQASATSSSTRAEYSRFFLPFIE